MELVYIAAGPLLKNAPLLPSCLLNQEAQSPQHVRSLGPILLSFINDSFIRGGGILCLPGESPRQCFHPESHITLHLSFCDSSRILKFLAMNPVVDVAWSLLVNNYFITSFRINNH